MMRALSLLTGLALLVACGSPAPVPEGVHENIASVEPEPLDPGAPAAEKAALASCGAVTAEGYCGVTFGMTPAQAAAKFPVKFDGYDDAGDDAGTDPNHCFELFAGQPVQGVSFLVENSRIGRVDFVSDTARTADGFGVGTKAEAIKAKFGASAQELPNRFEPEVTDLTVTQGAVKFVFEVQAGEVRGWRAGVAPTIDYTAHCSPG